MEKTTPSSFPRNENILKQKLKFFCTRIDGFYVYIDAPQYAHAL